MKRGDIYWADLAPRSGSEQAGRRPALVLSPKIYNAKSGLALICPITSQVKGYPFEVLLPPGLPVHGVILCEHMRSMDWRVRNAVLIGKAPDDLLLEVREIVGSIAGITP